MLIKAKENKLPKLVVPVHFSGQSWKRNKIWSLSQEYGFKVIEDASHALGKYLNKKVVVNTVIWQYSVFTC